MSKVRVTAVQRRALERMAAGLTLRHTNADDLWTIGGHVVSPKTVAALYDREMIGREAEDSSNYTITDTGRALVTAADTAEEEAT